VHVLPALQLFGTVPLGSAWCSVLASPYAVLALALLEPPPCPCMLPPAGV
jgi:hypothetical protein